MLLTLAVRGALPVVWAPFFRQYHSHKKALRQVRTDSSDYLASLDGTHTTVLAFFGHDLRGGLSAIARGNDKVGSLHQGPWHQRGRPINRRPCQPARPALQWLRP